MADLEKKVTSVVSVQAASQESKAKREWEDLRGDLDFQERGETMALQAEQETLEMTVYLDSQGELDQ